MDIVNIVIVSLAIWRIASLIAVEDGPFLIFAKFRYLVGVRYDDLSETYGNNEFAKAILCVWCSSLWIAAIVSLFFATDISTWLTYTFAISTVTIMIDRIING